MVMDTGVEWLSEPEVPVTIRVTWDASGGCCFELLPPHPSANSEMRSNKPKTLIPRMLLRVSGFCLRVVRRVPNSPRLGSRAAMPYPPIGGVEVAETVNVEDDALDPGEIVEGLKAQVRPAAAEQLS